MKSKRILTTLVMVCICTSALVTNISAQTFQDVNIAASELPAIESTTAEIQPRADIIDWRYKFEDGKMYRRQYNYTKSCWLGQWELC